MLLEHDGAAFALIRRSDPVDAITPYGYGGPVGRDVPGFWRAYDEWCREQGVVTTFVRFHPLYANAREAPIHVEALAPTIAWRLDGDDLAAGMHLNHRRAVRKAQKAGVSVSAGAGVRDFVPLYEETMRRAGASAFYFFAPAYWEALARTDLVRFEARLGDDVVASALASRRRRGCTTTSARAPTRGARSGAMHLLFLETATWARERGYERLHLGGGVGGREDSLHEFKRRFDPGGLVEAAVGKVVHDEAAYARLSGGHERPRRFLPRVPRYGGAMIAVEVLFWTSLAGILWTHVGYPLAAALLARVHTRHVRKADVTPSVTVIIPAHDEEDVIARAARQPARARLPARAARDRRRVGRLHRRHRRDRHRVRSRDPRIRLLPLPRGGKLAALNHAVGESTRDVVAFSDANSKWAPDALRKLVRNLADESVAYVCGKLRLERPDGTNREGVYWRYELWLRESESRLGSITGGNGSIFAVRRTDYVAHRFGLDLGLPGRDGQEGAARRLRARGRRRRSRRATSRRSTAARCGCSRGRGSTCSRAGCSPASGRSTSSS